MDHFERCYLQTFSDTKRSVRIDSVRDQLRKSAADMRGFEDVLENAPEVDPRDVVRKDRHRAVSKIEGSNVVESEYVIDVTMCDENGINALDLCPECLLSKIRRGVDKEDLVIVFDQDRDAQAFVARILGETRLTIAGDRRNPCRCACTEESEFHV